MFLCVLWTLPLLAQKEKDPHTPFSGLNQPQQHFQEHISTGQIQNLFTPNKPQAAFPEIPPDRFDFGRLSSFNEVHEAGIKDLQQRVRDIEGTINLGRGIFAGVSVLLVGLGGFVTAFWKGIFRLLAHESGTSSSTPTVH